MKWTHLYHTNFCNPSAAQSAQQGFLTSLGKHRYHRAPYMEGELFSHYLLEDAWAQRKWPNCTMVSALLFSLRVESKGSLCYHREVTTYSNSSSLPLASCSKNYFNTSKNPNIDIFKGWGFSLALDLLSKDHLNGITAYKCARSWS